MLSRVGLTVRTFGDKNTSLGWCPQIQQFAGIYVGSLLSESKLGHLPSMSMVANRRSRREPVHQKSDTK